MEENEIVLETERLIVRKFNRLDFRNFLRLHQNPNIMHYFQSGVKSTPLAKKTFDNILKHQIENGFSYWAVVKKSSNEFIGQAGFLHNYDKTINLCFAFLEEFQGKGFAYESLSAIIDYGFNKLNLYKITAIFYLGNEKSHKMLEKLGMKFSNSFSVDGKIIHQYSLTKDQYLEK